MLPTTLRNPADPIYNTSCLLLAIDSEREKDLELVPFFNDDVIGENEILVAEAALKAVKVPGDRKEKIEVYFDVAAVAELAGG